MYSHLDLVDPSIAFKHGGFVSIDGAHREGKTHMGSWVYVIDLSLNVNDPKMLLLKRGKTLVTCPDTWSLLGEHAFRDESHLDTVHRAILEELGSGILQYVKHNGRISNLTELPVYYERDYGRSTGNRIDRQVTYLWLVEMNIQIDSFSSVTEKNGNVKVVDSILDLDHEFADHQWISIHKLKDLLPFNVHKNSRESDLEFCHHTIISLTQLGLKRLLFLWNEHNNMYTCI